jgi:kinesin family protein 15
MEDVIAIISKG